MDVLIYLPFFIFMAIIEEFHLRTATGKNSHWWMCNQRFIRNDKVLDVYDFPVTTNKMTVIDYLVILNVSFKLVMQVLSDALEKVLYRINMRK